jgi:hypothetical protein
VATIAVYVVVTWDPAHQVSLGQAEQQLGTKGQGVAGARPARGVYLYTGSGTDRLSLPPLVQQQGPTMPGTVTLRGADCWTFRIDYSSHHWETWDYCRQGGDTVQVGGQIWQLWPIGPLHETNLTNTTCTPAAMSLPATAVPGQTWQVRCTGTSTAVKGTMHSAGPYRFLGMSTLTVGGTPVRVAAFLGLRTDSGSQRGAERTEIWLDASNGLPVRLTQHIQVVTATPFGTSTYTQSGTLNLRSLVAHT